MNINIVNILSKWYENTGLVIQMIDEQIGSCERQLLEKEQSETRFRHALNESKLALEKK
jgi:hypothetical protein